MHTIMMHSRMGTHSLPSVLGWRAEIPRAQRLRQHCILHGLHDERHLKTSLCLSALPCSMCSIDNLPSSVLKDSAGFHDSCDSVTLGGWHTTYDASWIALMCMVF